MSKLALILLGIAGISFVFFIVWVLIAVFGALIGGIFDAIY
jgi:hypothetical protein